MRQEETSKGEEGGASSLLPLAPSPATKRLLFWTTLVLTLILDQWVKAWVRGNMRLDQSIALWPNVFEIRYAKNTGIAFGQLEGKGVLLTPIAIVIAIGAVVYIYRHPRESRWNHIAFGLLASGALGNLYDRVVAKEVTDMFFFRLINFPIFNVADACITVATIMLMIGWWRESATKTPPEPKLVENPGTPP